MTDWDYGAFTRNLIADLRANKGVASSGPMAGQNLMILTTTGAKTGEPRVAVVDPSRDGDTWVIAATKSGAPTNPAWYHNLVEHPEVNVEVGGESFKARAVVADPAERDRLWANHVVAHPRFAEYPEKTEGRVIPVVTLERID
jgi:deazaflavin-dependent oxidoreductase (nitroreductase family)